jgi:hypothetical protein
MKLTLLTREGCCLCIGLEERLRELQNPPELELLDVDSSAELKTAYGHEVPLLTLNGCVLPRVPPRLQGERLQLWLQKQQANCDLA